MSNYKVKVNNEAESREVQELFFELGYGFEGCKNKTVQTFEYINTFYFFAYGDLDLTVSGDNSVFSLKTNHKELTILQLKDLVVLKRNSIDDAQFIDDSMYKWYVADDGKRYRFQGGRFIHQPHAVTIELKPIIKPLKEYLVPQDNGKYTLTKATEKRVSDWVEVPEGANIYASANDGISTFWGDEYQWTRCGKITRKASEDKSFSFSDWQKTWSAEILWQRHTQPEELPFVDDEPKSLNDTYAEIEQVRQDNVNNPSHYSDSSIECIDAMEAMMTPEQFIGYLRGNVFKYQWRYEKKNGIEDLKKAQWYLDKLVTKVNEK